MMVEKLNFFILVYNRANDIPTLNVLHKYSIFENIFIVVGKDDPKLSEVKARTDCKILVFDKADVAERVDSLGTYRNTLKVCTFARVFVDDYAKSHNLKYICLLFDDIESMQIRYIEDDKVKSCKDFDLKLVLERYLELLDVNPNIYMIGPPGSSFYIGCNPDTLRTCIATHYANMLIYDAEKIYRTI